MPLPEGFKVVYEPDKAERKGGLPPGFRVVQTPKERGDIFDSLAQGLTFGFADEALAAVMSVPASLQTGQSIPEAYRGLRDTMRSDADAFSERNPGTALAAEAAGGILTGGAGLLRAGGRAAAKSVASSAPRLAGAGAGAGGVAGLGYSEAEDVAGMARDVGVGAATGALAGAVLPLVAKAVGRAVTAPVRYSQAARQARPAKKLGEAIARDDMTPEQLQAQLNKLPAGAAIADAGGESVQTLARDITVQPGRARNLARALFEGRRKLAPQRIDNALRGALNQGGEFHAARDALESQARQAAKPLYEQAYSQPVRITPKLKTLIKRPSMQKALKEGKRMADEEGGVIGGHIQALDYAKRALDDQIGKAIRAGKNQTARALMGTKKALLDEMDSQVPAYAKARAAYSGPKAMEDALESGRKFMREDAEDIVKAVRDMSPTEKEFFRMGAIREIRDKVLSKSDTANAYRAIFDSPLKRDKIRALFPDSKSFAQFARAMAGEARMYETAGKAMGNSSTANKLAGVSDIALDPGTLVDAATGGPTMAALNALKNWMRRHAPAIRNEKMRDEIAELLFTSDRKTQQRILKEIGAPVKVKSLSDIPLTKAGAAVVGAELAASRSN